VPVGLVLVQQRGVGLADAGTDQSDQHVTHQADARMLW
jgi:hypothetical protein